MSEPLPYSSPFAGSGERQCKSSSVCTGCAAQPFRAAPTAIAARIRESIERLGDRRRAVLECAVPSSARQMQLRGKRYSFVVSDPESGSDWRFSIPLWPALAGACGVLALPILIGLGAKWSARTPIADLQSSNASLRVENASYRAATGRARDGDLVAAGAVNQLGEHAAVDPAVGKAMEKLPAIVKSRAMGGAPGTRHGDDAERRRGARDRPWRPERSARRDRQPAGLRARQRWSAVRRSRPQRRRSGRWPAGCRPRSARAQTRSPATRISIPGLDISADYGQPVLATGDGIVASAGPNGSYGNMVVARPRLRHRDALRPPLALRRHRRPARQPRRCHRVRRIDRPLHRRASALRDPDERKADQPAEAARAIDVFRARCVPCGVLVADSSASSMIHPIKRSPQVFGTRTSAN